MNRIADYLKLKSDIVTWLGNYIVNNSGIKALLVGGLHI